MNFASSITLVGCLLVAGCAGAPVSPAQSARAAQAAPPAQPQAEPVELRHFYLLSPGPKATLVVTRSDVAPQAPSSP